MIKTFGQFLSEAEEHGFVGKPDHKKDYRHEKSEPLSDEERVHARKWVKAARNAPRHRSWFDQHQGHEIDLRDTPLEKSNSEHVKGTTLHMHHRAHGITHAPTHKIVPLQSSVVKSKLMRNLNDRRPHPTPVATYDHKTDRYYLHGGHHRIASEIAAGRNQHKLVVVPNIPSKKNAKYDDYNYASH
jgi:hypothetical protein